jgi:hypothetical protein
MRLSCRVGQTRTTKTSHTLRVPGIEPVSDHPTEIPLPRADVLIIEEEAEGGVLLLRYTCRGAFGGDTWHASVEDAKAQAQFEFDGDLSAWRMVGDFAGYLEIVRAACGESGSA